MNTFPTDLKYTKDHEWARVEGKLVRVGVTAYAVEQLGDVTLVDLPRKGAELKAKERFGDIESVKTVSELFAPVSGKVADVNTALETQPELINEGCYDKGWMLLIEASSTDLTELMDAAAYQAYVGGLDH